MDETAIRTPANTEKPGTTGNPGSTGKPGAPESTGRFRNTGDLLAGTVEPGETRREERLLALLGDAFPGWRYALAPPGSGLPRWWACRYVPPTPAQHAAGVRMWVGRTSPAALAEALAVQADICHRLLGR